MISPQGSEKLLRQETHEKVENENTVIKVGNFKIIIVIGQLTNKPGAIGPKSDHERVDVHG